MEDLFTIVCPFKDHLAPIQDLKKNMFALSEQSYSSSQLVDVLFF